MRRLIPQFTNANSSGEIVFNANGAFQSLDGVVSLISQLSTVTGVGPSGQLLGVIGNVGAIYQDSFIVLIQLPSSTNRNRTLYWNQLE